MPLVVKAWRTRQTRDISLIMFAMVSTGIALWLVYGVLIGSWPLIGANVVTLMLTLQVLWLKLKHG
jgi:MtN3 and saliva related transmembrane protein